MSNVVIKTTFSQLYFDIIEHINSIKRDPVGLFPDHEKSTLAFKRERKLNRHHGNRLLKCKVNRKFESSIATPIEDL